MFLVFQARALPDPPGQRVQKLKQLFLACHFAAVGNKPPPLGRNRRFVIFVPDNQHRLRQIERAVLRIERHFDNRIRQADVLVLQPRALAPEHKAGTPPRRQMRCRIFRSENFFDLMPRPCSGRIHRVQIRQRLTRRRIHSGIKQNILGIGRRPQRRFRHRALLRRHQPHFLKAAVLHRPRRHADVFRQLRFHQNNRGRRYAHTARISHRTARISHRTACTFSHPLHPVLRILLRFRLNVFHKLAFLTI